MLLEHKSQWSFTAQIFGAARPFFVLSNAFSDIHCNAGIQAAISAAQQVKTVFPITHDE